MKKTAIIFVLALVALLVSCYTPSPLYGSWSDNSGNKVAFMADGTFTAKFVTNADDPPVSYDGNYTVIDNVLVFILSTGLQVNTEWDIRGSILYLTWTTDENTKNLSLYHTGK